MDSRIDPMGYQAYLVRIWPARRDGTLQCRVSLDHVNTGERIVFTSLEKLHYYLEAQAETSLETGEC